MQIVKDNHIFVKTNPELGSLIEHVVLSQFYIKILNQNLHNIEDDSKSCGSSKANSKIKNKSFLESNVKKFKFISTTLMIDRKIK